MRKADAIKFYKSVKRVAEVLGCRPTAVSQWPDVVPRGSAYELQVRSRGRLRVDESLYGKRRRSPPRGLDTPST